MEIRKYDSIPNIYKVSDGLLNVGDIIHVSEKIDGANASFRMDESGVFHYYSRNKKLSEDNGLRGFVPWCEENINYEEVRSGYIFYGEWVVRHKINYTAEVANTFILFDIYNVEKDEYLNQVSVETIAEAVGLRTPKKLYYGEYISLKHLEQFVGVGEHCDNGEGIVIRNWSNSTMCKWVREDFREERPVKQPKEHDSIVVELFEALCTEARIEKVLHKGLDEGIYKSFDQSNFGKIMDYCSNAVVADAIKENSEVIPVDKLDEFVKYSKKRIPNVVKEILCKMGE